MAASTLNPAPKPTPALVESSTASKKKLVRRRSRDYSQALRRGVQIAFLVLNVVIGVQFYRFVRFYETGAAGPAVARPAGVEGWLPIAGLMNLKYFVLTGRVPEIHPAGMFLLAAFLTISLILRKAFCSWLCPVGTLSEYLWKLGRKVFRRNPRLPRWLDLALRSLKYLLLAFFLYAVASMSARAIAGFLDSPYGLIADVKMLDFFRYLSETAVIVLAVLVALSVVFQNFWCRYLCPYGALLGLTSVLSPLRIRRHPASCIDCAQCAKACPAHLPVDQLITIRSAECTACLECVAVCPAEKTLALSAPAGKTVPAWAVAGGLAAIFLGTVTYARVSGHWTSPIPPLVYRYLVPHADQASHPMPGD